MNNPNPFVPKGSLLEQQNKRRTQMKLGVLCVLTVSVAGLMAMLVQGCNKKPAEDQLPATDTNSTPVVDTNTPPADTNMSSLPPATAPSNTVSVPSPGTPPGPAAQTQPTPVVTAPQPIAVSTPVIPDAPGADYVVAKHDTLAKIAKKNGVTLKALLAANPDAKPTKLKVGQKLVIPAGGKSLTDTTGSTPAVVDSEGATYTVKSGDTLTKIAKAHHVKVKALQAANGLTTTNIKVGRKLKIPSKGGVPAAPVDAPATTPTADSNIPAPPVPMVSPSPAASNSAPPVQH
jgi:LysM repeat protein